MKYIFWILVIFLSCKSKKESNCTFPGWKTFSIYSNTASVNLPNELFKIKDTINHGFEYDKELLYTCQLYTPDSLSSVFIMGRNNPLSNKSFVEYGYELLRYHQSLFKKNTTSYSHQRVDTLENKKIFQFAFLSKRESHNITFGGLIFYVNNSRFE